MTTKHVTINIGPQNEISWLFAAVGIAVVAAALGTAWVAVNESHDRATVERAKIEATRAAK